MRRILLWIHQGLAWVVLVGLLLQFYFVGMALFGGTSFEFNRTLGYLLAVPVILLLVLALAGRLGRLLTGLSALLVVLIILQAALPSLRSSVPMVAALHPVNAVALLGLSAVMVHQARAEAAARP
jgi:ABC-type polysaccharide/polyol phosphate export permease